MLCFAANDPYTTNCPDASTTHQLDLPPNNGNMSCPICGPEARLLLAETAAVVCQCSRRVIYRWIEDGTLHFRELADRTVLVCGQSLAARLDELETTTSHLHSPRG